MNIEPNLKDCFISAKKDEDKGKKHKGLIIVAVDVKKAQEYVEKAKINLEVCDLYREKGLDYKIPEEWFYTLYYCALAILSGFGIESRSQRCTALFLRYIKEKGLIEYDDDFIDRVTVYSDKMDISDVDERENARYGASIKSSEIEAKYKMMTNICKKCISQCQDIIFSEEKLEIPEEILSLVRE